MDAAYPFPNKLKRYGWNNPLLNAANLEKLGQWMALARGITEMRDQIVAEAEFSPRQDVMDDTLAYVADLNALLDGAWAGTLLVNSPLGPLFTAWTNDVAGGGAVQPLAANTRLISFGSWKQRLLTVLPIVEAEFQARLSLAKTMHPLASLFGVYKARGLAGQSGVSMNNAGFGTTPAQPQNWTNLHFNTGLHN